MRRRWFSEAVAAVSVRARMEAAAEPRAPCRRVEMEAAAKPEVLVPPELAIAGEGGHGGDL